MTSRTAAAAFYVLLAVSSSVSLIASYFIGTTEALDLAAALGLTALAWHWMVVDAEERDDPRVGNAPLRLLPVALLLAPFYIFGIRGRRGRALTVLRIAGWAAVALSVSYVLYFLIVSALT